MCLPAASSSPWVRSTATTRTGKREHYALSMPNSILRQRRPRGLPVLPSLTSDHARALSRAQPRSSRAQHHLAQSAPRRDGRRICRRTLSPALRGCVQSSCAPQRKRTPRINPICGLACVRACVWRRLAHADCAMHSTHCPPARPLQRNEAEVSSSRSKSSRGAHSYPARGSHGD